jgi:hypothetical protein
MIVLVLSKYLIEFVLKSPKSIVSYIIYHILYIIMKQSALMKDDLNSLVIPQGLIDLLIEIP